ncbi:MAG: hypothetical protein KAG56_10065 [Sulfurovaceae bacterium]|nr:hypothetical protein [Sulfurovaceae bacterium]
MNAIKIRKNFLLDKEIIEKAQIILLAQHKNLTEVINMYFKAIVKEPSILEMIEKSANRRTGSFIGMLDGKIGNDSFKEMKKQHSYKKNG